MTFVSRTDWQSRVTVRTPLPGALPEIVIHHVAGRYPHSVADEILHMRELQHYAINTKGYRDIDYNLIVGPSGTVYEARGIWYMSAATLDRNLVSRSICAMGNYQNDTPTPALIAGIVEAGRMMIREGAVTPSVAVYGHSDNPAHPGATACPGLRLYPHIARIAAAITAAEPPEEDAMSTARIYRDTRYANMWLIGAGTPVHLTGELKDSYEQAGVPTIVDQHDQLLHSLLHQSGLTLHDLVPAG